MFRFFFWMLFGTTAACMLSVAGGMIFGILGVVLAWFVNKLGGPDYTTPFTHISSLCGVGLGIIAGFWLTRDILLKPRPASLVSDAEELRGPGPSL